MDAQDPPDISQAKRRPAAGLLRALFGLLATGLWIVVLGITLELFALASLIYAEHQADAVESAGTALPDIEARPVDCPAAPAPPPDPAASLAIRQCSNPGSVSAEDQDRWRQQFLAADEADRRFLAEVFDHTVVIAGPANQPLAWYGSGTGRLLTEAVFRVINGQRVALPRAAEAAARLRAGLDQARSSAQPAIAQLPHPMLEDVALDAAFIPRDEGIAVLIRNRSIEIDDALFRQVNGPLPPDTPWEIPYVRYKPNLRGAYSGMGGALDTNNLGFRGKDVTLPKPEGLFRILCIGGSTTEEGGSEETTYPALLEQHLRERFSGKSLEVVNCGVSGMDTRLHLLRLCDYLRLEPDLMVFYEGVNDVARALPDRWYERASWPGRAAWHSQFIRRFCPSLLLPSEAAIRQDVEGIPLANLEAIQRIAAQLGIRTAFCSIAAPRLDQAPRAQQALLRRQTQRTALLPVATADAYCRVVPIYNEALQQFCADRGVLYLPVAEHLAGDPAWFTDVCHMNDAGINAKAEIVSACLQTCLHGMLSMVQ